eukprot:6094800-Lingulodinium_polyedra.AAC.1
MHSDTEVQYTTLAGRGIGYPSLLPGGACPPGPPTFPSRGVGASTWLSSPPLLPSGGAGAASFAPPPPPPDGVGVGDEGEE